ncbi:MAG: hypothetical protein AB7T06_28510 [Kofleriaceae bacterium]
MRAVITFTLLFIVSCGRGDDLRGDIRIVTDPQWEPALREMVALTPYSGLHLVTPDDDDDSGAGDYLITVVADSTIPPEGFRLRDTAASITVYTNDVLGAQYGVAASLEALGFRFRHPYDTYTPHTPVLGTVDNAVQSPAIRVRGFQLHTLHPIEAYFAMWEPGAGNLSDAKRIIDWTIKNRGNYVQWVGLDNIIIDDTTLAPWLEHTKAILEYGRARGVKFGTNVQLFRKSNLQQSFDLINEADPTIRPFAEQIAERVPLITTMGVTFDTYHISFGEFLNPDTSIFINALDEATRQLRAAAPGAEVHGFVHVGNSPRQRIDYMGENIIFYFLVKFATENLIPDIHTTMYYDMFEDAGGAYHHDQFDEHLAYLRERMCASEKVAYVPETSYWVAFDNSVPQFFPLYVRSRWLDLDRIRAVPGPCGTLDQHIIFTTGWEWGYWLNDVASLRASYSLPSTPEALIREQLAPDLGPEVSRIVERLMEAQRDALIDKRLAAYIAGRDAIIDGFGDGSEGSIIAAPDRIDPREMTTDMLEGFEATILSDLDAYTNRLDVLWTELSAFDMPDSRWARELRDGFASNRTRAHFLQDFYRGGIAAVRGNKELAETHYARAQLALETEEGIVQRRHADLHDTHQRRLVDTSTNKTTFQYGYLFYADNLCYWRREMVQIRNLIDGTSTPEPACFLGR